MKHQKKNSILSKIKSQIKLSESAAAVAADFENHATGDYDVILIESYGELFRKVGRDKTGYKGRGQWYYSNHDTSYEIWTENGTKQFFVLAKKGWENIMPPDPKTTNAYDEYGMSLIAILVKVDDCELLHAMLRWGSAIDPSETVPKTTIDNAFLDWGDLSKAVGFNVKTVVEKEFKRIQTDLDNIRSAINDKLKAVTEITPTTLTVDEVLSIKQLDIPDNITSIGAGAFAQFGNIISITIPDSVTSIGRSAFRYCNNLTSITIGNSVTSIGDDAFAYCYSLRRITIPASVESIGDDAFDMCINLTNVTFKGKTMDEVRSMRGYPWGIDEDEAKHTITVSRS